MAKIRDLIAFLEHWAPKRYQESYDNSGLLVGNAEDAIQGVLVTLDCTEEVVNEAVEHNCNVIVAHHPIIFKGLKRLTGSTYVERTVMTAIRNNVAIYAIHTNLDSVHTGVNRKIADKLQLQNVRILLPRTDTLMKLTTFIPQPSTASVLERLYSAGAGEIGNYDHCSFRITGTGTFRPNERANPAIGERMNDETVTEDRVEVIFPEPRAKAVMAALRESHPYEEVAHYLTPLVNENQEVGAGMIGELELPLEPIDFLRCLKERMEVQVIRHTSGAKRPIRKVALCGGAGSFLLQQAIASGADAFVSADFKYHEFFDAEDRIMIADIGHYESEVYTKELLQEVLTKKFPTFAINFSRTVTNPISYF